MEELSFWDENNITIMGREHIILESKHGKEHHFIYKSEDGHKRLVIFDEDGDIILDGQMEEQSSMHQRVIV